MFAVIMAGGSGTRFWPASRDTMPKQFLPITSQQTMFEETVARIKPLVEDHHLFAVVKDIHAELTQHLFGEGVGHVLVEPVGRNTAPCIGLAAIHARQQSADEPMVILPSDHFVANADDFRATVAAAANLAQTGAIVTLGITPTRPETGYGYIEIGDSPLVQAGKQYFKVSRFVEKPDVETATRYVTSGRFLWNSGIFVFSAKTILAEIEAHLPKLYAGLLEIEATIGNPDLYTATLNRVYRELDSVSIDYGVMEKTTAPLFVFQSDFGWSDVGSWQALYELRTPEHDDQGNLLIGTGIALRSSGNLVYSKTERQVALLGVEDLVIVDLPDTLLVSRRSLSQDVKLVPQALKTSG